jgi:N4-gp56 family major capsid protein
MSQFTWTFDQPSGVFKNHKLSNKIREASVVQTLFAQFCDAEPGYGKKSGESVTVTRISNIAVPTSSVLVEGQPISEDVFSLSTQQITVAENGRAVPFTSFSQDLAYFDEQSKIQKKLMQQMKISMDNACATAAKSGKISAIPNGIASIVFDTDGTPSTTATVNLNMYGVKQIRDYMFSTLNLLPFDGKDYMCLISTKAKRGIVTDPEWIDWHKYTDPESMYNSEIGRVENIRFMEVNNTSALSGSKGTGSVLGEAVFFGEDFLTMAVAQDPELRAKIATDYGRSMGVAWYGIYGFGQIWSDSANAGEARSVLVTSA